MSERNPDSGRGSIQLVDQAKAAITALMLGAEQHEKYADELRALASKIAHPPRGCEVWVGMNGRQLNVEFRTEWDPETMTPKYVPA